MTSSKYTLWKATWVPALAFALSVLLIAGQTLNCCRLNETISATLGNVFKSLVHASAGTSQVSKPQPRKTHAGCPGHGPEAESPRPEDAGNARGPHINAEETCLSEVAFVPKALPPVSTPEIGLTAAVIAFIPAPALPRSVRIERPRPQNRSSPPVYLLTLRLLV